MTEPKFYNKDGSPTKYLFSCGGVDTRHLKDGRVVKMWMEHGAFHVRCTYADCSPIFWDSFANNELTKARKRFKGVK